MDAQSESELRRFVEAAQLPASPESIVKRDPPEPDVRCCLESGEELAIELVEICNPVNARFMSSSHRIHRFIMLAYRALQPSMREAFESRFVNRPLSFSFRPSASLVAIRNVLPTLLTEVLSLPESDEYTNFSPGVAVIVKKVCRAGRVSDVGEVNFNLGGYFDSTIPLDALVAKLSKQYRTDAPVELLAHFDGLAWEGNGSYRESFVALFEEYGLGPFRRIWVLDGEGIGMVIPDKVSAL